MLQRLASHESMMLRRVAGELSTQVDLDLVRSRILQGQVEATQARTGIKLALTRLQNLTGRTDLGVELATLPTSSPAEVDARYRLMNGRTDWDVVVDLQPSVIRAREEWQAGQRRIEAKEAEAFPQVYARVDHAMSGNHDTTAYLGLRYTPGAGFATAAEASALAARALAQEQTLQATRLETRQTLESDRDDYRDNGLRAQALDAAVSGARRVFESYERQFPAGRKTWIDLMNAVREEAQNAYSLADARAGQAAALNRLLLRVGPDLIDVAVATAPTSDGVAIVPPTPRPQPRPPRQPKPTSRPSPRRPTRRPRPMPPPFPPPPTRLPRPPPRRTRATPRWRPR
ncbi:MAG: TolC family protein, partial [Variovorax sp.]